VTGLPVHAKLILDVPNPGDILDKLLGKSAGPATISRAPQDDGGSLHLDIHIAGVDLAMAGQQFTNIIADSVV